MRRWASIWSLRSTQPLPLSSEDVQRVESSVLDDYFKEALSDFPGRLLQQERDAPLTRKEREW